MCRLCCQHRNLLLHYISKISVCIYAWCVCLCVWMWAYKLMLYYGALPVFLACAVLQCIISHDMTHCDFDKVVVLWHDCFFPAASRKPQYHKPHICFKGLHNILTSSILKSIRWGLSKTPFGRKFKWTNMVELCTNRMTKIYKDSKLVMRIWCRSTLSSIQNDKYSYSYCKDNWLDKHIRGVASRKQIFLKLCKNSLVIL